MTFLDSNIFVYFIDPRNPGKKSIAESLVETALTDPRYVISDQVLNEFANVAMKKLALTEDEVRDYIVDFQNITRTRESQGKTLRALEIKKRYGTQFYDSLLLATAEANGCDEFLSEDLNDGQLYCGIKAVNPFKGKE